MNLFKVVVVTLLLLITNTASALNPLEPLDTSSPRATMKSFVVATEAFGRRYTEYRASPSSANQDMLWRSGTKALRLLDLSKIPPAGRWEFGFETFLLLWEVMARVELPEIDEIPDESAYQEGGIKEREPARWRIPGTEITIVQVEEGDRSGEFLFSPDTVNRAQFFYDLARDLPYLRPVPIENMADTEQLLTGWMIPMTWVEKLPAWANVSVLGQVFWKWLASLLLFGLATGAAIWTYRWSHQSTGDGLHGSYLRRLSTPLLILTLTPLLEFFTKRQINVSGYFARVPDYVVEVSTAVAFVWLLWVITTWIAELVIASPRISSESLDAHMIRLAARSIGILAVIVLIFRVGHDVGIPVYGLVAGAGVSGLAVALAAKNTLENFMGALNLFADRPIRVGDLCRYDDESNPEWKPIGRIESIGLRSTKIRRFDRGLITTPNAVFAQRNVVNLSVCDRFLLDNTLGLRYETTDDQLRFVLAELRELLHAHPKTIHTADDPIRVRFTGFGEYSLDISVRAYIRTTGYNEFLAIQEDILLRFMKIITQAGTDFAFPSRTLYHRRDAGLDSERQQTSEKQVREWASAHNLPFPDFAEDYREKITDTLDYPPEGSPSSDGS